MDPYLLTRIGDVTIQRVLPKQDAPKKEATVEGQIPQAAGSSLVELDLSMKSRSSMDKAEDEGGGGNFDGANKNFNYSDASEEEDEGDISEEMDEDDEQDVPLSLVTTKRNQDKSVSDSPFSSTDFNVNKPVPSDENRSIGDEVKDFGPSKSVDYNEQLSNDQNKFIEQDKELSETIDNDDDMPLSRLMAGSEHIEEASDAEGESDMDDEKLSVIKEKTIDEEDGEEEGDMEGEGEEELEEPEEEEDGPENLVKGEGEDEEQEAEQEDGGSGDDDPDREMIVVKQEPFEDEEDEETIKRKMIENDEEADDNAAKKSKKGSGRESGSDSESGDNSQSGIDKKNTERKLTNLRKNIREVMDENQLDEATLAAQRQEMERLRRVQEQQRIIREVNRQINLNRQNTKTQTRVISLLQGGGASLLKASPPGTSASPKSTSPNTVLVKLSSGSGPPQVVNKKVLEILRSTKSAASTNTASKASALANKLLNKPHSLTPSVSIAPVKPGLTITKMSKSGDDDKAVAATIRKVSGKKGKDVVTISSSSSDEDDCILISEPSGGEEEEEEEDPTNSGMHTNDLYNVPDDQGRVLINVGRPENEPDVFLAPQIARIIKPHQIGGVRFLFDNVVESLERFKTSSGFGCILAHSMGLGKTLQVVSFCDVFLRYTEGKTILCIMPINTLQNWMAEFNMWLPVEPSMSPFSLQGDVQPRTFPLFVLNDLQKSMVARAKVVIQWAKEGGVLLIGYELYRQLSLQKPRKRRCNSKRKINPDDDIDDEKNKHLLEEMHAALVKPGPDLVICDEGHRIKNSHASISQALKQIRSKRRVVLTGYPLQNNLLEYWCMVDFVRPNYLGTKTEFSNMFERPIQNGQCIDSTPQDIRLMRYRAHVLHSLLEGFVQRRSHSVLTNALPQKEEYVILVRMTTFQRKLYDTFMNEVVRTKAVPNPLKAFAVCCKIWNHPDVLYHFLKRRMMGSEAVDLDLEETAGALVPPTTPAGTIVPVLPVKRGRGRSPKGTSPVKRERKVNPRKRGGADQESPAKSPVVAAVMPNTTNSNPQTSDSSTLQSHTTVQPPQQDVKPPQPFPQQPGNTQFRPNFPYPNNGNNQFPSQYPGMNQNYGNPNFNPHQQGDFGMPPPYPGFQNQQGFNNQNMYSNFGGNYYSSQQDQSFGGGNYWNNPFFNNDPNNPSMFPNYNDPDTNNSNFYNQDMMGSDGFSGGHRGYNSGMGINRPGMSGMNPLQQGRMGMNNSGHGMMGMNSGMGGMNMNNMNSMGMPMNNMNPGNMTMNQNNFGMNSMGMNSLGQGNLGMNSQNQSGMNISQSNMSMASQSQSMGMNTQSQGMGMNPPSQGMGMNSQSQGMGMNQMGVMGSQNHGTINMPPSQSHMGMNNQNAGLGMNMPGMSQSGMSQVSQSNTIISQSSMSSQQNSSSSNLHTMTSSQANLINSSNQNSMESQQQAAIENIANNLMMSTQQSMQGSQGLLGGGDNHNSANSQTNLSNTQNTQQSRGNSQNLMNPQHDSQSLLGDSSLSVLGNTQSMPNNHQNLMGGISNQNQMGGIQSNVQNSVSSSVSQNPSITSQSNMISSPQSSHMMSSSQSSHMMANMITSSQSSQNISGQHGSQNPGTLDGQNMLGSQSNSTVANQQNIENIQNQQNFFGNQPNSSMNMQNPMFRNQQSNQNMFSQQSSSAMMVSSQQGMFGGNQQVPQQIMGSSQNNMINPQIMSNQHNMLGGPGMSGLDQTSSQGLLNNQQSLSGNQQGLMGSSQNQNMLGNQDSSLANANALQNTMSSQKTLGNLSGNQDPQNNQLNQNMYGNQSMSNPMGNLQNMINNQNMMSSQSGSQNVMQNKSQSDLGNNQDPNNSLMGMNQNMNQISQQNMQGNPSGIMMNQQGGINDSVMGQGMLPNQQHGTANQLTNSLMDNQQNMFGMNSNQMNTTSSGFMNSQNIMGHGMGNPSMNNQPMMGGSQNMGMVMNTSGQGMYGNQMNPHDMMSASSNMMGNQMNNPSFNPNQMGNSSMMGMYNQPGMMNYPGMMMGNQMNNFGMMNQQNMNSPNMLNQNQSFGNNMMRNPSAMMGIRNPQSVSGLNPDMNQAMMGNNFSNNQSNFGMFGNNSMNPNNFSSNQNNQVSKASSSSSFQSGTINNSRFMSGGEFLAGNSQSNSQDTGNLSQTAFNNDFVNYGLNNDDSKMWDDLASKCSDKPGETIKSEKDSSVGESCVKSETDMSSQDGKLKTESGSSLHQTNKPKSEDDNGCDKKEGEEAKKEDIKSPKGEGTEGETKDVKEDVTATGVTTTKTSRGEDAGIPYDWATELLKGYVPGNIEASAKMALFFCILEESMCLGDRVLVFSQSLFTLNLIEDFLQKTELPGRQEKWARNWNYYRLDGSTSAMEREKLINEFNSNPNIHLFLVSTRAGSLGINLVGANRVVVLDASWNPCHDTQAVCRVYRYGQRKPCFVYRLVTDNCLEKKIYDRQVNKQGMADRVVDECNPDAHLSIKEVTNLCWDNEEDTDAKDFSDIKDKYIDVVMQKCLEKYSKFLSKEPFQHESLLVDRKDKKLSQAEKRLAKRSYELEKQANINNTRPVYGYYPGNTSGVGRGNPLMKPMASVRPMQSELNNQLIRDATSGRPRQWIPAEVWQKQGMSAQEMTLPLDVVIPTNSPDRSSIVLKAGQKVMVLKSPKGIYMQLENGKIIAIRTAFKVGGKGDKKGAAGKGEGTEGGVKKMVVQPTRQRAPASLLPLRNNSNISIIPRGSGGTGPRGPNKPLMRLLGANRGGNKQPVAATKPYFGEGSAHPPVTVTVTKKRVVSGNHQQQPSTSTAQVEIRREPKQVTVTPIPPPSPKTTEVTPTTSVSMEKVEPSESEVSQITAPALSSTDTESPAVDRTDEVQFPVEIKPVKAVPSSDTLKEKEVDKDDKTPLESEDTVVAEKEDKKLPVSPQSLIKESLSSKISIEERAKMEPSLQPVVSLKNYRHLAFQSNKTVVLAEGMGKSKESSASKVCVNPLPFKTGSSLSISPVISKSSKSKSRSIELPSVSSSLSIQPVKLPPSTSVNLVKPHSSFSVTPVTEVERNSEIPKEPSMSITRITEKNSSSVPPSAVTVPISTVTPVEPLSKSKSESSTSQGTSENQPTPSVNIFPVNEAQKSSITVQPSSTSSQMSAFNPAIDLSFRPDFQQQLPGARTDFYPGFPRPPLGFPTGNFFPPRKDASGKDLPASLPQFSAFDAANYIGPNPFSAAAASPNFPSVSAPRPNNPFSPAAGMVQPTPQTPFETDFSRMYSAFHRPEPQQVSAPGFSAQAPQFNPYSYNPFLMHAGFPLPSTNSQPNSTPNPPNPPSSQ